jgi:hypothetical protein
MASLGVASRRALDKAMPKIDKAMLKNILELLELHLLAVDDSLHVQIVDC